MEMESPRVLVVEDSPTMRQLIAFSLQRIPGVSVVEADDGVDGLKKMSVDSMDLVITDINMPIMDGIKLVALMKKEERFSKIPIIVVTTEGATEDRDRAMALGADAYLTKPVQTGELLELSQRLLKLSK